MAIIRNKVKNNVYLFAMKISCDLSHYIYGSSVTLTFYYDHLLIFMKLV